MRESPPGADKMRERPPGADKAVDRATETPRDPYGSDTDEKKLSQFAEEDEAKDSRKHSERDVAHREADDTNIVLLQSDDILRGAEESQCEFMYLRGTGRGGRRVIGGLDEEEILNNFVRSRTATARMRQAEVTGVHPHAKTPAPAPSPVSAATGTQAVVLTALIAALSVLLG